MHWYSIGGNLIAVNSRENERRIQERVSLLEGAFILKGEMKNDVRAGRR